MVKWEHSTPPDNLNSKELEDLFLMRDNIIQSPGKIKHIKKKWCIDIGKDTVVGLVGKGEVKRQPAQNRSVH